MYENFKLSNSQYIPQFAGLPLETIERVGDELQGRHYENIAKLRQIELLGLQQKANAEAQPDRDYIDTQLGGIQGALSEIAKNGGENATGRIAALANQYLGDEGLINIGQSIASRQREKARLEQLGGKGIVNQRALEAFKARGSRNPETGKWEPYVSTAQEQLDYIKKADQIFDPLRANTYQTDLIADATTTLGSLGLNKIVPGVSGDISKLPAQFKTTVIEALTKKRIDDFVDKQGGWEEYKGTEEYRQQKDIVGLSDEEIKKEFIGRGYAKIYDKILKDWEANKLLGMIGSGGSQTGTLPPQGEQLANEKIVEDYESPLGETEDFEVKDRVPMLPMEKGVISDDPSTVNMATFNQTYKGMSKDITPERWKALDNYGKLGAEVFGGEKLGDINEKSSPEEVKKALYYAHQYEELIKNRVSYAIKDTSFTTRSGESGRSNAEDLTTDLVDNIKSRAVYDPVSGKQIPITNKDGDEWSDEFLEVIGSPKNMKVTGTLDPQNYIGKKLKNENFADAFVVEVTDPKNPEKTRTVYVTQKAYDVKNAPVMFYNRAVNRLYSEMNAFPGKETAVDIGGLKIKGKELIGKQLDALGPEERTEAESMAMPMLVDIPGFGLVLADGPKGVMDFVLRDDVKGKLRWQK